MIICMAQQLAYVVSPQTTTSMVITAISCWGKKSMQEHQWFVIGEDNDQWLVTLNNSEHWLVVGIV